MAASVGIIGAGPAGLTLALLLHEAGIDSVVLEARDRDYVERRVRAGLLEQNTVDLLRRIGVADRLAREGLDHTGVYLHFQGQTHHVDMAGLTGRKITIYGQQEVVRDEIAALLERGIPIHFEVSDVELHGIESERPRIAYRHGGSAHELACDFIAGCDGFHGACRASVPRSAIAEYERVYPFGWLGLLADTRPVSDELIYVNSPRGFALCSMRSRTRSRYYLQVPSTDDAEAWTDDAFWQELALRLDDEARERLVTGPSIEKSVAPLRSFVAEPLRFGRLFLAGDAGHIVPPTGAKGLNLAATDVKLLATALIEHYGERSDAGVDAYSERCLRRIWRAERFSWWFTALTHTFPDDGPIGAKLQHAELDYLLHSEAGLRTIAENYVGLPLDFPS
jgi:p-hydroxybenzoate 3-monooxygenase